MPTLGVDIEFWGRRKDRSTLDLSNPVEKSLSDFELDKEMIHSQTLTLESQLCKLTTRDLPKGSHPWDHSTAPRADARVRRRGVPWWRHQLLRAMLLTVGRGKGEGKG